MNYNINSDLMIEAIDLNIENEGIISNIENIDNVVVTSVIVGNNSKINKKKGKYITIEFNNIDDEKDTINKVFKSSLSMLMADNNISINDSILIVGLGNEKSTADSLGPLVIDNIIVTRHLSSLGYDNSSISAIKTGVTGETGIETKDIVSSIVSTIKPSLVIAIDALSASSINHLNKTIQMTDTGIHPGSGVGNSRQELSRDVLNVPVIAIGVPTVCDAAIIVNDTINEIHNHFAITTENINNPTFKLRPLSDIGKLSAKPLDVDKKKELSGIIGILDESDRINLIKEVLGICEYNLMVTPKEIDFVVDKLSDLISIGINELFHSNAQ